MYDTIAVAAAMERELGFLRCKLAPPDTQKKRLTSGTLAEKTIYLLRTGIGPAKTNQRLAELGQKFQPKVIISIGCAGALAPALRIGDAIVADGLFDDTEGGTKWPTTPSLVQTASDCCRQLGLRCHVGGAVSTELAAATPQLKADLAEKYGALSVDMESARIACWASASNIPMVSIRTISDLASDSLPPELSGAFDRDGNLRIWPTILSFALKPSVLYKGHRLMSNFNRSIDVLARIVHTFLNNL